jgi:hypothetical protein
MAIEAISELGGPVVVVVVTVTVELAEITPVKPFMLAVIWMTPWPVDVTNPEEFTDATSGPSEAQVTRFVTSSVVAG